MTSLNSQSLSNPFEIKAGMIQPFGGETAPHGWLICDGSAISRTTYKRLFDVIGTLYGSGDGATTFNLPNITGSVALKFDSSYPIGTSINGLLPNVTGSFTVRRIGASAHTVADLNGCYSSTDLSSNQQLSAQTTSSTIPVTRVTISANTNSNIYQNSATKVLPSGTFTNYIIKY